MLPALALLLLSWYAWCLSAATSGPSNDQASTCAARLRALTEDADEGVEGGGTGARRGVRRLDLGASSRLGHWAKVQYEVSRMCDRSSPVFAHECQRAAPREEEEREEATREATREEERLMRPGVSPCAAAESKLVGVGGLLHRAFAAAVAAAAATAATTAAATPRQAATPIQHDSVGSAGGEQEGTASARPPLVAPMAEPINPIRRHHDFSSNAWRDYWWMDAATSPYGATVRGLQASSWLRIPRWRAAERLHHSEGHRRILDQMRWGRFVWTWMGTRVDPGVGDAGMGAGGGAGLKDQPVCKI